MHIQGAYNCVKRIGESLRITNGLIMVSLSWEVMGNCFLAFKFYNVIIKTIIKKIKLATLNQLCTLQLLVTRILYNITYICFLLMVF